MKIRLLYIPMVTWCFSACISSKDYQQLTRQNKDLSYSLYQSQQILMDNKVVHLKEIDDKKRTISLYTDSCRQLNQSLDSLLLVINRLDGQLFVSRIKKRRDSIRLTDQIQSFKDRYAPYVKQKFRDDRIKDTLSIIKKALFLSLEGTSYTLLEQNDSLTIMIRYLTTPFLTNTSLSDRANKAIDSINKQLALHPFLNLDVHVHSSTADDDRSNYQTSTKWSSWVYQQLTQFKKNRNRIRMIAHGAAQPIQAELPKAISNSRIDFQLWVDPLYFTSDN